jgi:hypothetical protein
MSLKSEIPRQSPNTNGFNNQIVVQWSSPVVETSAGEPLISTRLFAGAKCSAWLVSKESPRISGFKPSYTKICYIVAPHSPVVVPLKSNTQKNHKGYKNPLFPILRGDLTYVQLCLHIYVCQ